MAAKFPIELKKVSVHNLKAVSLKIAPGELVVLTGVSGSGKSSLAFDTIYTEGQRRYVESLSTFAKRQVGELGKPEMESASGISPTISIEQKTAGKNPRSTVGTLTQVYDFLRVLYARIGIPHCPVSGEPVRPQSRERIIRTVQAYPEGTKILVLAPFARGKKAEFKEDFQELLRKGFMRVRVDGALLELDSSPALDGNTPHDVDIVLDRLIVNKENGSRIAEALTSALREGEGVCSVLKSESGEEQLFSMHAYSPKSGLSYPSLEPTDFSFNSPSGMCPRCHGLGFVDEFKLDKILDPNKSIAKDCCSIATSYETVRYFNIYNNLAEIFGFKVTTPWKKLSEDAQKVFLYGTGDDRWLKMHFVHPVRGSTWVDRVKWRGVLWEAHQRFQEAKSETYRKKLADLMERQTCPDCSGTKLKPYPAATLLGGKSIADLCHMTIGEAAEFFNKLTLSESDLLIGDELLKEIRERLKFLLDVGLHYLTLDRTAPTLSGGEAQRVRLASQIGCGLVGITYILDEPSIGLHPRDNLKLIHTLKHLRDMGNSVLVVEHDEETILAADHILDFGPGAGALGGELVVDGPLQTLLKSKKSLTGKYLTGACEIPIPKKRRKKNKSVLKIEGASHHNLKNVDVAIPLGLFVAVTGVSGSGKSSLISETLLPALTNALHKGEQEVGAHKALKGLDLIDKVIGIDQSPIGRNPRSNPATYIKLFDDIRTLFCELPESRARGYQPGRFRFNVKEGSCPACGGMGMVKIDMDFMEDAFAECEACRGLRFDRETLSIKYKEKSIYDILDMEVDKALSFFENIPAIRHKLEVLSRVGLGYIKIGQFSTTLSGGEAQRIKLAKELVRPATGKTLYILDEPTTGLHFHDIKHLLEVLHELVERGNTVIVIEHNMDVVKTADWIIDLGPDGGAGGGRITASGPPEEIALQSTPTGISVDAALKKLQLKAVEKALKKGPVKSKHAPITEISAEGLEQNNLKSISATVPRGKITVCTGPSGSGKSSFAFDTIYAEGQRRYAESLSPYMRQFVLSMPKPKAGRIEGLSPAIAIEQKIHAGNPRSTVGTLTEIYDFLRLLFARLGTPHCPETGEEIKAISKEYVVEKLLGADAGTPLIILAPLQFKRGDNFAELATRLKRQGFVRIRLDGVYHELEEEIPFDAKRKHELLLVVDRLKASSNVRLRLAEAVESAAALGGNTLIVQKGEEDLFFNLSFAVPSTGKSYPPITPHTFSFNTADGMCPYCEGLGFQYGANITQNRDLMQLTSVELIQSLMGEWLEQDVYEALLQLIEEPYTPLCDLKPRALETLLRGDKNHPGISLGGVRLKWRGLDAVFAHAVRSVQQEVQHASEQLTEHIDCIGCHGARVHALARAVTLQGKGIHDICQMPIEEALQFVKKLSLSKEDAKLLDEVMEQLVKRLNLLADIGVGYLTLHRSAPTLSGGEAQRIRLARQLGSGLTGSLYVLDEPTIGLHPEDIERLNSALLSLRDLGNTLLLVEHDPQTISIADKVLDFGPGAGEKGGHLVAQGSLKEILKDKESRTGQYLSHKLSIPTPKKRRAPKNGALQIKNASAHNLKNLDLAIPIGTLSCLTGVSGSGKSTLVESILIPAMQKGLNLKKSSYTLPCGTVEGIDNFEQIISIDQQPIGHTSRSNVGTYVEAVDRMRKFFAELPLAKAKGLDGRHFSFNHRRGMCTRCWGMGYRKVEMHFLPPVRIPCDECGGLRLNPVSLEVHYKGKNFGEYLEMTVAECRRVFEDHPRITRILDTLVDVGLDYLKLGQQMVTLSGGEAQRIKLSRELARRSRGKTLYILDEPTTGLHFDDIEKLLKVLHRLVDKGNTALMIEHNIDMIKNADFIIDLGPGPGAKGGRILASGTPEELINNPKSITAKYLK